MKKITKLPNGGKVTVSTMTEKEFLKQNPNTIRIESEEDVKKLAKTLGVDYPTNKE